MRTKNIALVLISILLALLIAEFGARAHIFGFKGLSYRWVESVHNLRTSGLTHPSSVPGLLYEFKPNLHSEFMLVHLRTNSVGLREDKEFSIKKEPNVFRVAVIGDSLTTPNGVELEDAYFKQIENKLNSRGTNRRYEFINFAVPGYTLREYASVIEHKALQYQPDLILIGWCAGNDHEDLPKRREKNHVFELPYQSGFFKSYLIELAYFGYEQLGFGPTGQETEEYTKEERDYILEMLKKINGSVGKIPVLIAYLGHHEKGGISLQAIVKPFGIHFVSTIPAFAGTSQSEYSIHKLDAHPNAKANQIFADVIYAELIKQSLF